MVKLVGGGSVINGATLSILYGIPVPTSLKILFLEMQCFQCTVRKLVTVPTF